MATSDEVADRLRARILDGEFGTGDSLPALSELEQFYNADHSAVRRALHALERDGVITLTLVAFVSPPKGSGD